MHKDQYLLSAEYHFSYGILRINSQGGTTKLYHNSILKRVLTINKLFVLAYYHDSPELFGLGRNIRSSSNILS